MPSDDLTVGAALIVGWIAGSVWTLTVLRLAFRHARSGRDAGQGPGGPG